MKKTNYWLIALMVVLAQIIVLGTPIFIFRTLFPPEIKMEKCQKYLDRYQEDYTAIAEWILQNREDSGGSIRLRPEDVRYYPGGIAKAAERIYKKCKWQSICSQQNAVYFQLWSNRKYGRGVLYCTNINALNNELLVEIQPLSQPFWYFYIEE